jgi:hypothetical protein
VDVAEVALQALARIVIEGNERRPAGAPLRQEILTHPFITSGIVMFIAEASENLGAGVALLAWGLLVGAQEIIDDRLERIEDGGQGAPLVLLGLGLVEDLANLASGMMEASGELPNAELLDAMRLSNACVLVHFDHPPPPCSWCPRRATSVQKVVRVGPFSTWIFRPGWARIRRGLPKVRGNHGRGSVISLLARIFSTSKG